MFSRNASTTAAIARVLRASRVDENARIEQALRVERFLGGAQRLGEQRRALAVVPRAMIAPDRVVMGDRPAILDHGVERRALDREPLRAEPARLAERMEGEIGRGAVGIDMGEAAGDLALAAGCRQDRALGRG